MGSDSQYTPTVSTQQQQQSSTGTSSVGERIIPTLKQGAAATAGSTSTTHSFSTQQQQQSSSDRRGSTSRIIPLNIENESTVGVTGGESTSPTGTTEKVSISATERIIPTIKEGDHATRSSSTSQFVNTPQSHNRVLPIKKRGRFFQDATFEKVWRDFESAMDDRVAARQESAKVTEDKGEGEDDDDKFQMYRNLRDVVQQDDSQAATVTKESDEYKVRDDSVHGLGPLVVLLYSYIHFKGKVLLFLCSFVSVKAAELFFEISGG